MSMMKCCTSLMDVNGEGCALITVVAVTKYAHKKCTQHKGTEFSSSKNGCTSTCTSAMKLIHKRPI